MPRADPAALPGTVWVAAVGLAVYAVAVMLSAILQQSQLGWDNVEAQQFTPPLTRFVGMNLIAWGLSRRARWAWWAGLIVPGFFLAAGVLALAVYLSGSADTTDTSPRSFSLAAGFFVLLLVPVICLLTPASRKAFRRPAV